MSKAETEKKENIMIGRELLLKIALLITLLLCTAAKGYEIYVINNGHYDGSNVRIVTSHYPKQASPIYYRATIRLGNTKAVVSNVAMVWFDENGQVIGRRVLGQGDFELLQQAALRMGSEDARRLVERLCSISDVEYASLIKKLGKEHPEYYAKADLADGDM